MSYDGLNSLLQANDSLVAKKIGFVDSTTYDNKYEIPTGGVNYTSLSKDARPYDAVVSLSGENGTFKDIQAAITYVNSLGGGSILIKNGTYILGQNVTLFSNITLIGEDNEMSIINFNGGDYSLKSVGTSGNRLRNISIENLTVKGSISSTYGAIGFDYCDFITIKNCQFYDNTSRNIYFNFCSKALVDGCYSHDCDLSVYVYLSSTIRVVGNDFDAAPTIAIKLHRSNSCFVSNNRITNAGQDAIWCASCRTCNINGNVTIDPGASGIHLTTDPGVSAYCSVCENIMQNDAVTTADGILMDQGQTAITVTGNVSYGTAGTGFNFIDADLINFIGNTAYQKAIGISFGTASDRNVIVGNVSILCGTALSDNSTNGTAGFNIIT